MRLAIKLCVIMLIVGTSLDAANGQNSLPAGSRVVIAPMGGFETYFAAAVRKKNVPITLTLDKNSAQYFVVSTDTEWQGFVYGSGTSAGWNRSGGSIVSGSSGRSTRGLEASIMLIDSKTKDVVWAYEVHKSSHGDLLLGTLAARGKQSVAEACAKHLKEFIEKSGSGFKEASSAKAQSTMELGQKLSVNIGSKPLGAEIYVDDEFAGSTPSTISVPEGKHRFSIRKLGFQDWNREMTVSGSSISLTAELQAGATSVTPVAAKKFTVKDAGPAQTGPEEGWTGLFTKSAFGGGVQIVSVVPDSPASKSGLRSGDVITHVNGVNVAGDAEFNAQVSRHGPGSSIRVGYMRAAWAFEAVLTVGRTPL